MRGALLSTCCSGISTVFRKKSLDLFKPTHASQYVFGLIGCLAPLMMVIFYRMSGRVTWDSVSIARYYIALILTWCVVALIYRPLSQLIYQENTIASLMPFENINKVLSLVITFFVFHDVSTTSLMISLCAVWIIITCSIDFHDFSMPKWFMKILLVQALVSVRYIIMAWCVIQLSGNVFYVYEQIVYLLLLIGIIASTHTQDQITQLSSLFYGNRLISSFLGTVSMIVTLYLISEVGATMVILLWFLQMLIQLVVAYFYLHEIPTRRDIILTIIVSTLVWVWFMLK